jgi:amidase
MKESVNRVYGRTVNPYNRNLTSGGSSGGESALIALRGSAIGLGTDWGGSIREPAAWCGLYGLRPSWGRVSLKDVTVPFAGLETRRSTAGPMGHTPEDIDLYMSAYLAQNPWEMDPDVLSMPWTKQGLDTGTLCFAIAYGDEEVRDQMRYFQHRLYDIDDSPSPNHARSRNCR